MAAGLTLALTFRSAQDRLAEARLLGSVPVTTRLVRELLAQNMTPADVAQELGVIQDRPGAPRSRVLLLEQRARGG